MVEYMVVRRKFEMTILKEFQYEELTIPYQETTIKINENDFRKYFIIDIRNWNSDVIFEVFNNFANFQYNLLVDEFFSNSNKTYPVNLMLYFLIDENRDYDIDEETIKNNFRYAFKDFINYEQFLQITRKPNLYVPQRQAIYMYNGERIEINNFNLIFGPNNRGKTNLLKFIAEESDLPLFNLYLDLNSSKILTSATERLNNLKQIMDYCYNQNSPLLLDDMGWNAFDERNKVKIINQLYDYSHDNNVIFTSAQQAIKSLVKKRSHKPNIIDLS